VGIAVGVVRVEADHLQQLLDGGPPAALGGGVAVDVERLPDDVPHGHARVQRGVGVLEDDLDLASQLA
jgi:hypothetical protein